MVHMPYPRAPVDLPQTEPNSCKSCVAAQLLYMMGLKPQPNIAYVDRKVGRVTGKAADNLSTHYFLLASGIKAHTICAYNLEELYREGVAYLRRYYHKQWTPEWDRYFTPEWLQAEKRKYTQLRRRYARFLERETIEYRHPTLDDLLSMVQRMPVWLTIGRSDELMTHDILVYERAGSQVRLYYPDDSRTLRRTRISTLERWWLPQEGIVGVRRA